MPLRICYHGTSEKNVLSILLGNEGAATNRWEDGTIGVPEDVQRDAEEHSVDCPPTCPDCGAMAVYV